MSLIAKIKSRLPSPQAGALSIVTMLWGGTYCLISLAMQTCGPFFFVGVRFLMAACIVFCITGFGRVRAVTKAELKAGSLIGLALTTGYILQSKGLHYIPSSRSAFITALYVPLVPILEWLICRRAPGLSSWFGIALSFTGLIMIAGPSGDSPTASSFGKGELFTLAATVAIALEILFISMFSKGMDSRRLAIIELISGGIVAFTGMFIFKEPIPAFAWSWFGAALALALLSAGVQLVMNWAQQSLSATKATLIYSSEPIWGGLVGKLLGDPLPPTTILGAGLIVSGVIASEMRPNWPHFRRMFRGAPLRSSRKSLKAYRSADMKEKWVVDPAKAGKPATDTTPQNTIPPVMSVHNTPDPKEEKPS